jgi:hypothetical protein
MPASHPRMKLSKLCTATARCVGERSTGPRIWSPNRQAAKLHRKHVRYAAPGFVEGEGSEVTGPSQIVACTHTCATQQSCQSRSPGQSVLLQHRQGLCARRLVSTMRLALPGVQRRAKRRQPSSPTHRRFDTATAAAGQHEECKLWCALSAAHVAHLPPQPPC